MQQSPSASPMPAHMQDPPALMPSASSTPAHSSHAGPSCTTTICKLHPCPVFSCRTLPHQGRSQDIRIAGQARPMPALKSYPTHPSLASTIPQAAAAAHLTALFPSRQQPLPTLPAAPTACGTIRQESFKPAQDVAMPGSCQSISRLAPAGPTLCCAFTQAATHAARQTLQCRYQNCRPAAPRAAKQSPARCQAVSSTRAQQSPALKLPPAAMDAAMQPKALGVDGKTARDWPIRCNAVVTA